MGKLVDLIQRATGGAPVPLGFGSVRAARAPTMLIVAVAGRRWKDAVQSAASSGASAILLDGDPSGNDLKDAIAAAGDHPCGVVASQAPDLSAAKEAGIDFAVLSPEAPAGMLQDDTLSFLLATPEALTDIQLRTIEPLPVDALYLDDAGAPLTISRQMELQRISGLARKPLLLYPPAGATRDDLLALRDSGAALLGVDMSASGAAKTLTHLRDLVDSLPPRSGRRRGERADVTLPAASPGGREEYDEEDEE